VRKARDSSDRNRRRAVRSALVLAAVVALIYLGFILRGVFGTA